MYMTARHIESSSGNSAVPWAPIGDKRAGKGKWPRSRWAGTRGRDERGALPICTHICTSYTICTRAKGVQPVSSCATLKRLCRCQRTHICTSRVPILSDGYPASPNLSHAMRRKRTHSLTPRSGFSFVSTVHFLSSGSVEMAWPSIFMRRLPCFCFRGCASPSEPTKKQWSV
eukprot:2956058-Pleurochrysis_carterae.AAC.3